MKCSRFKLYRKERSQRGATALESVMAVTILFLIVFAMLQVYKWCVTEQICQYSAFYASKSLALGFEPELSLRAARVAGIAMSGRSVGAGENDEYAAENYMVYGDGSGVRYEYWHQSSASGSPSLHVYGKYTDDDVVALVRMENDQLLNKSFSSLFSISRNPVPSSRVYTNNYAKTLLEE